MAYTFQGIFAAPVCDAVIDSAKKFDIELIDREDNDTHFDCHGDYYFGSDPFGGGRIMFPMIDPSTGKEADGLEVFLLFQGTWENLREWLKSYLANELVVYTLSDEEIDMCITEC